MSEAPRQTLPEQKDPSSELKGDQLLGAAGYPSDEPFVFLKTIEWSFKTIRSSWESLLASLNYDYVPKSQPTESYLRDDASIVSESNSEQIRLALADHYNQILALATREEQMEYLFVTPIVHLFLERVRNERLAE